MQKQVAGTIMLNDQQGTHFLVGQTTTGYYFHQIPVAEGHSPLGSVLAELRQPMGIDVDQLRLYDSIMAQIDDAKVAVFVFDHLQINEEVRERFAQYGLTFIPASQLHGLFESVKVDATAGFADLSK
ncbi:hypothetical protein [Lactiplantibacillus herbarum]|uniref:hypothetical protein n=1 Tax=Lactiplantibacillus herbarum TaxID=1670446 RepID=UPI00064F4269|nr:hypothetical protein [Lactiplantibacillus herbarum]